MSLALPRIRTLPAFPDPRPRLRAAVARFRTATEEARLAEQDTRAERESMRYRDVLLDTIASILPGIPLTWLLLTRVWPLLGIVVVVPESFYVGMAAGILLMCANYYCVLFLRREKANATP